MIAMTVENDPDEGNRLNLILEQYEEITELVSFLDSRQALAWICQNKADVVFLTLPMLELDGMELAKEVRARYPTCAIMFVASHDQYALRAIQIHANGYFIKPVVEKEIIGSLKLLSAYLRRSGQTGKPIKIRCFGNFEVFAEGRPIKFKYTKTKELLAYLIDRNGASIHINTLCAILWEDREDSASLKSYLRHLILDLDVVFKKISPKPVLVRQRGKVGILTDQLDCDYFDWLAGHESAIHAYSGEYMIQYSWAEVTMAQLDADNKRMGRERE